MVYFFFIKEGHGEEGEEEFEVMDAGQVSRHWIEALRAIVPDWWEGRDLDIEADEEARGRVVEPDAGDDVRGLVEGIFGDEFLLGDGGMDDEVRESLKARKNRKRKQRNVDPSNVGKKDQENRNDEEEDDELDNGPWERVFGFLRGIGEDATGDDDDQLSADVEDEVRGLWDAEGRRAWASWARHLLSILWVGNENEFHNGRNNINSNYNYIHPNPTRDTSASGIPGMSEMASVLSMKPLSDAAEREEWDGVLRRWLSRDNARIALAWIESRGGGPAAIAEGLPPLLRCLTALSPRGRGYLRVERMPLKLQEELIFFVASTASKIPKEVSLGFFDSYISSPAEVPVYRKDSTLHASLLVLRQTLVMLPPYQPSPRQLEPLIVDICERYTKRWEDEELLKTKQEEEDDAAGREARELLASQLEDDGATGDIFDIRSWGFDPFAEDIPGDEIEWEGKSDEEDEEEQEEEDGVKNMEVESTKETEVSEKAKQKGKQREDRDNENARKGDEDADKSKSEGATSGSKVAEVENETTEQEEETRQVATALKEKLKSLEEKATAGTNANQLAHEIAETVNIMQCFRNLAGVLRDARVDELSDEIVALLSEKFFSQVTEPRQESGFLELVLLPKLGRQTGQISRTMFGTLSNVVTKRPDIAIEALLVPLIFHDNFSSVQADVLKRLLKETLPSPKLSQFLFEFIAANERKLQLDSNTTNTSITEMEDSLSQQDVDASQADPSGSSDAAAAMLRFVWNDYIVGILQLVLDAKPLLGNHLPRLLVQLDKQAAPLASSLPFSALILGLITKYPDMVSPHKAFVEQIVNKSTSFLKRSTLTKLAKL